MQFHHIIFQTYAIPVTRSLPKPSPLDSMKKWLAGGVTRIVLSFGTALIDRALAEDLAAIFEVKVSEIPSDASGIVEFICNYVDEHSDHGVDILMYRLQIVAGRLHDMMEGMIASYDDEQ
jgi:hypothetical protein